MTPTTQYEATSQAWFGLDQRQVAFLQRQLEPGRQRHQHQGGMNWRCAISLARVRIESSVLLIRNA